MNFKHEIDISKASYLDEWDYTSELYHRERSYDLLTNDFKTDLTTLEIGCGAGYSIISLSEKSKNIIAIDENINCIESTYKKLTSLNSNVSRSIRGTVVADDQALSYKMEYEDFIPSNNHSTQIQCIEGDILTDSSLISFLKSQNGFDLVTCWMMGAHGLILSHELQLSKGRTAIQRQPQMVQDYKFDVLEQIAEVSLDLLNKDGILSIAERMDLDIIRQFGAEEILKMFNDRIEPYGYELTNGFEMYEIKTRSKMTMVTPLGTTSQSKLGLLSLKYKKTTNNS